MTRFMVTLLIGILISSPALSDPSIGLNTAAISKLTGVKGYIKEKEKIYEVIQPRDDLQISVSGIRMMPSMGLISWAVFKNIGNQTMVLSNLVLTEDQIRPILDVALNNGFHVISLENHYLWESPKVMFMRIEATGDENKLAANMGKLFKAITQTSRGNGNFPLAMFDVTKSTLNPHKIDDILHTRGILKDGVYSVIFNKTLQSNVNEISLNNWASFAGADKEALVVGDFTTDQAKLDDVLLALHNAGFYIVSIHPHLTKSNNPMVNLHYFGVGSTKTLAKGLYAALTVPEPKNSNVTNPAIFLPLISSPDDENSTGLPLMTPLSTHQNFKLNLDMTFYNQEMRNPILDLLNKMKINSTLLPTTQVVAIK